LKIQYTSFLQWHGLYNPFIFAGFCIAFHQYGEPSFGKPYKKNFHFSPVRFPFTLNVFNSRKKSLNSKTDIKNEALYVIVM